MKTRWKRVLTGLLVIAMLIGLLPSNLQVASAATVSLTPIATGTATIGSKTKSGTWYQMEIGGKDAFCMDLHKSCSSGDKYSATASHEYSSNSDSKRNRVLAKLIFWYTEKQNRSTRAFLITQGLIWYIYDMSDGANEDKYLSKDNLVTVIQNVKTAVNRYSGKTASELYNAMFETGSDKVITSTLTIYKKDNGAGSYQRLLILESSDKTQPKLQYSKVTVAQRYRQRVRVHKQDDNGNALSGVTFNLRILPRAEYPSDAVDQLHSFYVSDLYGEKRGGWTLDNDGDRGEFNLDGVTDASGNIGWLMVYRLNNYEEVAYFTDSDVKYNADHGFSKDGKPDKDAMVQYLIDEEDLVPDQNFVSSNAFSKSKAEALAQTYIASQIAKINNGYVLKETSVGSNDVKLDPNYASGKGFVLKTEHSITKNGDVWPDENADPWEYTTDFGYYVHQETVTNELVRRRASIKVVKKSADANYKAPVKGAKYRLYGDAACTQAAHCYDLKAGYYATPTYTTKADGSFITHYLDNGGDYWLKEIEAPEGYQINPDPIHIHVDMTGQTAEVVDELTTIETTDKPYYEKYKLVKKADKTENTYPLAGARYKLFGTEYADRAKYYDENGDYEIGNPVYTTDKNGELQTDYLDPEEEYWLEEIEAPEGFKVTSGKIKLEPNAHGENVVTHTEKSAKSYFGIKKEYCPESAENYYYITQMQGGTVDLYPEAGAEFEVWLAQYDSYDDAPAYARCKITTGEAGMGYSSELIYGKYKVHQTKGSDAYPDAKFVKDFTVHLPAKHSDGEMYIKTYNKINYNIQAHLQIQKTCQYDGKEIPWTVAGAKYQIFKYNDHTGEYFTTPLSQKYVNPQTGKEDWADTFITDKNGVVYTTTSLSAGKYKIVEVAAPEGTAYGEKSIEVVINKDTIKTTEVNGVSVDLVKITNLNHEQMGRFAIKKTGPQLVSYQDGKFVYEDQILTGAKFEVTAAEDIKNLATGETVIGKGTKVATLTTGKAAQFVVEHKGMTSSVDQDGVTWITLPLGKYTVKEVETAYGYLFPEKSSWDLTFAWDASGEDTVIAKDGTDQDGVLTIRNELTPTKMILHKEDAKTQTPIGGAVFDLYTKDAIYNAAGKKIVDADAKIATLTTDADGKAVVSTETGLPFMDAAYASGSSLNSGDYYLVEKDVSASYLLDATTRYPVHLEYQSSSDAVITAQTKVGNTQTTTKISKVDAAGSEELDGCELELTDQDGKVIASWITGKENSLTTDVDGSYLNFTTEFDKGNLILHGLHRDSEYTLTEKRPADGYATADSIVFKITAGEDASTSIVSIKQPDGSFVDTADHLVVMVDDQTQVKFTKLDKASGKPLAGAQIAVTDEDGKEVAKFESKEDGTLFQGILIAGKTYTFTETQTPDGYVTAQAVQYKVKDTTQLQTVTMEDAKTQIRIVKTDTAGKPLAGAKFTVTDPDGKEVMTFTSTEDGVDITGKLIAGQTYTFTETEAPDGYVVAAPVQYKVKDTAEVQTITIRDKQTEVHVSKRGLTGEEEVPGCKLKVTDKKGNVIDEWVSGKEEHVILGKLVAGEEYILSETYPADGYTTANDVTFRVGEDGSVQTVIMKDAKTQIRFTKVSETVSGPAVAGAQITVTDPDGKEVAKFETKEDGTDLTGILAVGKTYTFTETKTPDGYVTAQAVQLTVKDTPEVQAVTMVDQKTHIKVVKTDTAGKPLAGAKFRVTDPDGKEVMTFTSTQDGVDITGILAVGKTYTFTETKAPEGYEVAAPVQYTIKDTDEVQTITIEDELTPTPTPETPDVPQTGADQHNVLLVLLLVLAVIAGVMSFKGRKQKDDKDV